MKPFGILFLTAVVGLGLASCDGASGNPAAQGSDAAAGNAVNEAANTSGGPTVGAATTAAAGAPLAAGAPDFASLYPEAELSQPVVLADGIDGPGGIAEFNTTATPDDVIAHYRRLADMAGLRPVMSMNQGNARAFAALNSAGAEVQVVASQDETGSTSVQLTWKSGR